MDLYYTITLFIFGLLFGSFFNVVGYRLPKGESIAFPPSHCPNCNHRLTPLELIPVFSFLFQKGKCKSCGMKISWFYAFFELLTGILFATSYIIFGLSISLAIALLFISMLIIIVISDYHYMIIPDEVLIFFGLGIIGLTFLSNPGAEVLSKLLDGVIAFSGMLALKLFGDFIFKKESMGGGDIKLMFILGFVLGWETSILLVFLASFIGLPISIVILYIKKEHEVPFGPFLSLSAIILFLTKIDMDFVLNLLTR